MKDSGRQAPHSQLVGKQLYGAAILLVTTILWASSGPTTKYLFLLPAPPSAALLTACVSTVTALFLVVGLLGSIMEGRGSASACKPELEQRPSGPDQADEAEAEALLHSGVHTTGSAAGAASAAYAAARCAAQHQQEQQLHAHSHPHSGTGSSGDRQGLNQGQADLPPRSNLLQGASRFDEESGAARHSPSGEGTRSDGTCNSSAPYHSSAYANVSGSKAGTGTGGSGLRSPPGSGSNSRGCWRLRLPFLTAPARSLPAAGMELGVYNVMAAALGAWGMQRISATRSAFLAQATSLITPLLVRLSGGRVGRVVWLACCCGAAGGAMVALDNVYGSAAVPSTSSSGAQPGEEAAGARRLLGAVVTSALAFGTSSDKSATLAAAAATANGADARALLATGGDGEDGGAGGWPGFALSQQGMGVVYVLLSCVFWGLGTVRLGTHSARFRPLHLAAAAAVMYAGLSVSWLLLETVASPNAGLSNFLELGVLLRDHVAAALLLWAGLGPGALSSYLQVVGQQTVPPAQAQVLFSSAPLWSALIAQLLLPGEAMGPLAWLGGAVMLGASLMASLWQ